MLHRRDALLRLGQLGYGVLTLPVLLQKLHRSAHASPRRQQGGGTARSCILIYLWGGPPQQDTFDMKPNAPEGIRGCFDPSQHELQVSTCVNISL